MSYTTRTLLAVALVGSLGWFLAFPDAAQAGQAKTEVRWLQWKTTEVGEKLMSEVKAALAPASVRRSRCRACPIPRIDPNFSSSSQT